MSEHVSSFSATVLQVIPELETGGAERTTLEVAEAIITAGGRAIVASAGGPLVEKLLKLGASHVTLPLATKNPLKMISNKTALEKLIRKQQVDLVHARSRAPAWSAYFAAISAKVPFVTTYHGIYSSNSPLKRFYNSVMARGDYVIANSNHTREHVLLEHYPRALKDDKKLITIPRGADLSQFDATLVSEERKAAIFAAWGGQNAFRLLLPGRLTPWKGQRIAIEAARHLQLTRQEQPFRLVLAGGSQGREAYEAELRELILGYGLEDVVHLAGHLEDMPAGLLWADAVLSMSERPEAFGRVAIEAQAMGRLVVASDHGGARETVLDGETGYLVAPSDAADAAQAIAQVMSLSKEQHEKMRSAARLRARDEFSTDRMTQRTLNVYKMALQQGSKA